MYGTHCDIDLPSTILRDDGFGYAAVRNKFDPNEKDIIEISNILNIYNPPKDFNRIALKTLKLMMEKEKNVNNDIDYNTQKSKEIKEETKNNYHNNISINELKTIISDSKKKFIGQEAVIDDLAMNIYLNTQIINKKNEEYAQRNKSIILLDGPTGTGKTAILQDLSNKMSVPFVKADATSYTSYGYKGASLTDILIELLDKTNGNIELAQEGIVCLDEFDKLASATNERSDQVGFKKSIQHELLKFGIDGEYDITYHDENIRFDTSKLTIIYMGAFTNLREKKKTIKNGIGFNSELNIEEKTKDKIIDEQSLVEYGYERELVGRIKLQATTKKYTEEDLKNILLHSQISPLLELKELFASNNKILTYDDDFIDAYITYAYKRNTGARALQKIADEIRNIYLSTLLFEDKKEIHLTSDIIKKLENNKGRRLA